MYRWWIRYLPYALVLRMARRDLERFNQGGFAMVQPFRGEIIAWLEPRS
jgi:hypothetical protein